MILLLLKQFEHLAALFSSELTAVRNDSIQIHVFIFFQIIAKLFDVINAREISWEVRCTSIDLLLVPAETPHVVAGLNEVESAIVVGPVLEVTEEENKGAVEHYKKNPAVDVSAFSLTNRIFWFRALLNWRFVFIFFVVMPIRWDKDHISIVNISITHTVFSKSENLNFNFKIIILYLPIII